MTVIAIAADAATAVSIHPRHGVVLWSFILLKQPVVAGQIASRSYARLDPLKGKPKRGGSLESLGQARRKPLLPVVAAQPGLQNRTYSQGRLGGVMLHAVRLSYGSG